MGDQPRQPHSNGVDVPMDCTVRQPRPDQGGVRAEVDAPDGRVENNAGAERMEDDTRDERVENDARDGVAENGVGNDARGGGVAVEARGEGAAQAVEYVDPCYDERIQGPAKELVEKRDEYDFIIACPQGEFEVHKEVLVCFTDYFSGLFRSNMQETRSGRLYLEDVDREALSALVAYMYTGRLSLTWDSSLRMFVISMRLSIAPITYMCSDFIMSQYHVDRSIDLLRLTDLYPIDPVKSFFMDRLCQDFVPIANSASLSYVKRDQLCELLASDNLNTRGEMWLFLRVSQWLMATCASMKDVSAVLKHIRYALMTDQELEAVQNYELVSNNGEVVAFINEALHYVLGSHYAHPQPNIISRVRTPKQCLILTVSDDKMPFGVLACSLEQGASSAVRVYELYNCSIYSKACGACVLDNFLFVFSVINPGVMDADRKVQLRRLDVQRFTLVSLKQMPTPRYGFAMVVCGGYIYTFGGKDMHGQAVRTVEKYCIATNTWASEKSLTFATAFCAAVAVGTDIIISGGALGPDAIVAKLVFKFDTLTSQYEVLNQMVHCRRSHDMQLIGSQVYVMGGIVNHAQSRRVPMEVYDFNTSEWAVVSGYRSLGGSSTGHYLPLPNSDVLYVVSREHALAEERDIWKVNVKPGQTDGIVRWAKLRNNLSASYACCMSLNLNDLALDERLQPSSAGVRR